MTTAILFAAGKGSRLAPITDTLPKPLVTINAISILERTMEQIHPLVESYTIVIGYLGHMIRDQIGIEYKGKPVYYQEQANPKGGTLDALRTGLQDLREIDTNVLVMNSDDIHGSELFTLLRNHISQTPSVPAIGAHRYSDTSRLSQFGIIKETNGVFQEIVEKPTEYVSDLVNIGVYYIPHQFTSLVTPERDPGLETEEYITDFINLVSQQASISVIASSGMWHPVSYPEDIEKAEKVLA